MARDIRINRWLDLADRVGWTALQAAAASLIVVMTSDMTWEQGLATVGIATGLAACKVVIAQNAGSDDLGAAVPGHVIETDTVAAPRATKAEGPAAPGPSA